jgi:hypothetical protein
MLQPTSHPATMLEDKPKEETTLQRVFLARERRLTREEYCRSGVQGQRITPSWPAIRGEMLIRLHIARYSAEMGLVSAPVMSLAQKLFCRIWALVLVAQISGWLLPKWTDQWTWLACHQSNGPYKTNYKIWCNSTDINRGLPLLMGPDG